MRENKKDKAFVRFFELISMILAHIGVLAFLTGFAEDVSVIVSAYGFSIILAAGVFFWMARVLSVLIRISENQGPRADSKSQEILRRNREVENESSKYATYNSLIGGKRR
jgi:hypothetical protein